MTITSDGSNWALHCLVRSDMHSLNPGKAMAQVAHASSAFSWNAGAAYGDPVVAVEQWNAVKSWHGNIGFGTTLVFGFRNQGARSILGDREVSQSDSIMEWIDAFRTAGAPAGLVIDPTYPLKDGSTVHLIPNVLTVGWFFADRAQDQTTPIGSLLYQFRDNVSIRLHP